MSVLSNALRAKRAKSQKCIYFLDELPLCTRNAGIILYNYGQKHITLSKVTMANKHDSGKNKRAGTLKDDTLIK